jgi:hypothetical protein
VNFVNKFKYITKNVCLDCSIDYFIGSILGLFSIWTVFFQIAVFLSLSLMQVFYLSFATIFFVILIIIKSRKYIKPCSCDSKDNIFNEPTGNLGYVAKLNFSKIILLILSLAVTLIDYRASIIYIIVIFFYFNKHKKNIEDAFTDNTQPAIAENAFNNLLFIILLSFIFAFLSIVVHRPDLDDSYHLNIAINSQLNPFAIVSSVTTIMYEEPNYFWLPFIWRIQSLHQLLGLVGFLTNINSIYLCHLALPALSAILVVLAQYRLFAALRCRNSLILTIISLIFILISANTNISIGNFGGFVRLHHGNGIFFTAIIPLILAYSVILYRKPSLKNLLLLGLVQISSVGLTSTAILLAPLATILVILTQITINKEGIKKFTICLLSLIYPVIIGSVTFLFSSDASGKTAFQINKFTHEDVITSSLLSVLGQAPIAILMFFLIFVSWIGTSNKTAFQFSIFYPITLIIFILNPIAVKFWTTAFIPENVYYRMIYLFNIPTLASFAILAPYNLFKFKLFKEFRFYSVILLVLLVISHLMSFSSYSTYTTSFQSIYHYLLVFILITIVVYNLDNKTQDKTANKVLFITLFLLTVFFPGRYMLNSYNAINGAILEIKTPQLKVQPEHYRIAELSNHLAPKDTIIAAPVEIASWVTVIPNNRLPLLSRHDILPSAQIAFGQNEIARRFLITNLISGRLEINLNKMKVIIEEALDIYPISVFCVYSNKNTEGLITILEDKEFKIYERANSYTILNRIK